MELETMEYLRRESAKTHLHIFHVTPVSSVKTKLISRLPLPVEMNRHIYTFLNGSRTIRHVPYIYSKKYKEREDRILSNSLLFVGNERNSCFVRVFLNLFLFYNVQYGTGSRGGNGVGTVRGKNKLSSVVEVVEYGFFCHDS